jgi:hypothetical protein
MVTRRYLRHVKERVGPHVDDYDALRTWVNCGYTDKKVWENWACLAWARHAVSKKLRMPVSYLGRSFFLMGKLVSMQAIEKLQATVGVTHDPDSDNPCGMKEEALMRLPGCCRL